MGQSDSKPRRDPPASSSAATASLARKQQHPHHQRRPHQHAEQPEASTSTPSTSTSTSTTAVDDNSNTMLAATTLPPDARAAPRRSSLRKSVMNFVRGGPVKESRDNSGQVRERRMSWRSSRRWSKSPVEYSPAIPSQPPAIEEEEQQRTSTSVRVVEVQPVLGQGLTRVPSTSAPSSASTSTSPAPVSTKGKEPARNTDDIPQDVVDFEQHMNDSLGSEREAQASAPYPSTSASLSTTEHQAQQAVTSWLEEQLEAESGSSQPRVRSPCSELECPIHAETQPAPPAATEASPQAPTATNPPEPQHPAPPLPPQHASTTTAPSSAPQRPFPPPGTLVVVQGIVHTTDVARPDEPTSPASPSSQHRHNRHQHHPNSNTSSRPRFSSSTSASSPSSPATTATEASTRDNSTGVTTPEEGDGQRRRRPSVSGDSQTSSRAPAISPGSIDVLGTLLSVAAAATAASLLTGSADPNQPNAALDTASITSNGTTGQSTTSPGDASSDANATPNASTVQVNTEHNYLASRAERMRQAWGTIRERLGLRPTPPSPPGSPLASPHGGHGGAGGASPASNAASPDSATVAANATTGGQQQQQQVTDTRELMLAEMARAFNIGLGLNGMTTSTTPSGSPTAPHTAPPTTTTTAATTPFSGMASSLPLPLSASNASVNSDAASGVEHGPSLPPEGSFDRFLVDLQADLRIALTQDEEATASATAAAAATTNTTLPSAPPTSLLPSALTGVGSGTGAPNMTAAMAAARAASPVAPVSTPASPVAPVSTPASPVVVASSPSPSTSPVPVPVSPSPEVASTEVDRVRTVAELDDMPALEEVSESEDEESDAETGGRESRPTAASIQDRLAEIERLITQQEQQATEASEATDREAAPEATVAATTAEATTAATHAPTTAGSGRIDANGRINWWRLYRFPSINAPRIIVPGAPPATSSPTTTTTTTAPNTTTNATSAPVQQPAPAAQGTGQTPFLPNFLPPPPGQTVVPVIVVGLQSVNQAWPAEDAVGGAPSTTGGPGVIGANRPGSTNRNSWGQQSLGNSHRNDRRNSWGTTHGSPWAPARTSLDRSSVGSGTHETVGGRRASSTVGRPGSVRSRGRRSIDTWSPEELENDVFGYPPLNFDDSDEEEEMTELELDEGEEEEDDEDEESDYFDEDEEDELDVMDGLVPSSEMRNRERRHAHRGDAPHAGVLSGLRRRRTVTANNANANSSSTRSRSHVASRRTRRGSAGAASRMSVGANTAGSVAGASANMTSGAPGSRTFLIYVIGGYYPPDHTIVTGGLENFESFEALLELAEMLGQAKPPTVTKEDIDKSGLEIIKPEQLSQYMDEGRVAYNCVERCLICLDDYDHEDDIRIMQCRHAFHRDCVDKWLQTGKNNCPACRSTGVNTESTAAA